MRVLRWLIFGVIMGLIPIVTAYVYQMTATGHTTFADIIDSGELLLVSAVMSGAAVGEIVGRKPKYPLLTIVAAGSAVAVLFFASLYFAQVATTSVARPDLVVKISLWVLGSTVICGGSCVALGEDGDG